MDEHGTFPHRSRAVGPSALNALGRLRLPNERPTLTDLLQLLGSTIVEEAQTGSDLPIILRRVRAGENLFQEASPAETVYFVRSGTFKTFHTAQGGYEQLLGFVARGEVLGFDALGVGERPSEAMALEDSMVFALPVPDLFAFMACNPAFARGVYRAISLALARQIELADVTAAVAADVRLARFLMYWSRRQEASGQSPRRLLLRMSRRDIASYLGVAHETVSRSFSALAERGLIAVHHREVDLIDMEQLNELLGARTIPGIRPTASANAQA